MVPLNGLEIQETKFEPVISLERLHKLNVQNRKQIETLEDDNVSRTYAISSIGIFIGAVLLAYISIKARQPRIQVRYIESNKKPKSISEPPTTKLEHSNRDVLNLEEDQLRRD